MFSDTNLLHRSGAGRLRATFILKRGAIVPNGINVEPATAFLFRWRTADLTEGAIGVPTHRRVTRVCRWARSNLRRC